MLQPRTYDPGTATAAPSCAYEAPTTACLLCSPHTIEFSAEVRGGDDWLYVGLSGVGQISAVRHANLTNQRIVYRDFSNYEPHDLVIAPSCTGANGAYPSP